MVPSRYPYSLNLSPATGVSIVMLGGIILALISVHNEAVNGDTIAPHIRRLANNPKVNTDILFNRSLHFAAILFSVTYIVMFNASFDIFFMLYTVFLVLHWMFYNNDCVLNCYEKKYFFKDYKCGDNNDNVYLVYITGRSWARYVLRIFGVITVISFFVVLWRQEYLAYLAKACISFIFTMYIYYISSQKA